MRAVLLVGPQRARLILSRNNRTPRIPVVRQLHHTKIKPLLRIPPDMQNVNQTRMAARNRLKTPNPLKFPLKRPLHLKVSTPHDFNRP